MLRSHLFGLFASAICSGSLFVASTLAADGPAKPNAPAKPADAAKPAETATKPADAAKTDAKSDEATGSEDTPAKSADSAKPAKKVPAFMDARKKREEAMKAQFLAKYDKNGNGKLDPNEREQSKRDYAARMAPRPTGTTVRRTR